MVFWPLRGLLRRLTERVPSPGRTPGAGQPARQLDRRFSRSLHLYVVDVGCDNGANLTISALQAPQYNTHRYGIYFADSPRHADLLVVLGPALPDLVEPLKATLLQMPEPSGVLLLDDRDASSYWWHGIIGEDRVVGRLVGEEDPVVILALLLAIQRGGRKRPGRNR